MARPITADDVITTARLYRVPPELALAVWEQESARGTNTKTSPRGAVGGFQVIPTTFKEMLPGGNINNPVDNMVAGIKYLRKGLDASGGDPEGAAQFYYSGRVLPPGMEGPNSGPGTPTARGYGRGVVGRMANAKNNIPSDEANNEYVGSSQDEADMGLYGANDAMANDEPMSDIAGLTRPLDEGNDQGWLQTMGNQQDNELDTYVRKLVDEEFGSRRYG